MSETRARTLSPPFLVLSAGLPRSGSTWLYNALRLMLTEHVPESGEFACGWIDDIARSSTAPRQLVKLHVYDATVAAHAQFVAYSYRDLHDAIASRTRKFGAAPSLMQADYLVQQDALWTARADHVVRYEDMVGDPSNEITRLATAIGVDGTDAGAVRTALDALSYASNGPRNGTYNELTLLHRDHVTDGRPGSWKNGLPADLERAIVKRHAAWFASRGYDTTK